MVEARSGDNVNLLDSSLRAVGGTSISTSLYVVSGIVYAAVTTPEVAGSALFLVLLASLTMRPVRGFTQALHKLGSEKGEEIGSYFAISLIFSFIYSILVSTILIYSIDLVAKYTILTPNLLYITILVLLSSVPASISKGLLRAAGFPSYNSWISAGRAFLKVSILILFASNIQTIQHLLLVIVSLRLLFSIPLILYIGILPKSPNKRELKRTFNYTKWSVPDQVIDRFTYNMPTFILGIVATPLAVGIYEAADRFADFGTTISWSLSSVFLTKVSGDWSKEDSSLEYLDSAITGGIGITFVVVGYLIPTRDVIADIGFSQSPEAFSIIVIIVGCINILRGFWTITSHVMEGINKPSVSVKTKIFGLIISVPPTAILGSEHGALAGALGYGIMNIVVFGYVLLYSYRSFDRILIDWRNLVELFVATIISVAITQITIAVLTTYLNSISMSIVALIATLIAFTSTIYLVSEDGRNVIKRFLEMYGAGILAHLRNGK